jgi:hypothetical protein
MGIKGSVAALFLSVISSSAFASCESHIEKATKRVFYDSAKTDNGQLDGLVIGSGKLEVVSYLESKGVSKVFVVHEKYFHATRNCANELEKISNDGLVYISGRNSQVVGKIQLRDARVSRVELMNGYAAPISPGVSRDELVVALRNVLLSGATCKTPSASGIFVI